MFRKAKMQKSAPICRDAPKPLSRTQLDLVSGGIAESPPPAHDMLVRPGDTKGIAL